MGLPRKLPSGSTSLPRAEAWTSVCQALGIPEAPALDDAVVADAGEGLSLAGRVVKTSPSALALLLDGPAPGTAFIAVEGDNGGSVSVWAYLYGPDAEAIVARDKTRWQEWLARFGEA